MYTYPYVKKKLLSQYIFHNQHTSIISFTNTKFFCSCRHTCENFTSRYIYQNRNINSFWYFLRVLPFKSDFAYTLRSSNKCLKLRINMFVLKLRGFFFNAKLKLKGLDRWSPPGISWSNLLKMGKKADPTGQLKDWEIGFHNYVHGGI